MANNMVTALGEAKENPLHGSRTIIEHLKSAEPYYEKVFIFGAGYFGKQTLLFLQQYYQHIPAAGFIDNDRIKDGEKCHGIDIFSPESFVEKNLRKGMERILVIISARASEAQQQMISQCNSFQCEYITFVPFIRGFLEHSHQVMEAGTIWADELSNATYGQKILYTATADDNYIPPCVLPSYFLDLIPKQHYRSFVDGGAFYGDTLKEYMHRFGADFDDYYAFEPSPDVFNQLKTATDNDYRIKLYNQALFNQSGIIAFDEQRGCESGACIYVGGKISVPMNTLDSVLSGDRVTFIKMDVEGSEMQALEGAAGIVQTQRPAMAICVYHNLYDLWEIPLWIKRMLPNSSMYLRHHSQWACDTVCYVVPAD